MNELIDAVNDGFKNHEKLVMATILEKNGSTPREQGTKMLIQQDFSIVGTIGGGIVEALTIKAAAKVFEEKTFRVEKFSLTNEDAGNAGMVCGGNLIVLLEYLNCDDVLTIEFLNEFNLLRKNKSNFMIVTDISETNEHNNFIRKWICTETGLFGSESNQVIPIIKEIRTYFEEMKYSKAFLKNNTYFIEPFFNNENIVIFGAGHIGKVLAEFCKKLGFYVVVVDDREDFANNNRFNTADEIRVIPSYEGLEECVNITPQSYVIIVTRGHSYDKEVLSQMLDTDARYIGMIGSKNKRKYIYKCLLEEGYTQEELEMVHSPIGLPIFGQTPEEIAISIVAEIILVRRGPKEDVIK
jgi:xanthine dehydrogenase accessory factor